MFANEIPKQPPPGTDVIDARVVFLTHYIPLYQVRVLQSLAASIRDFRILLSTPIEPNRDFTPDWAGLNVTVQNTWTVRRRWRHRTAGFDDPLFIHVPYDTTRQLRELKPDVVMSLELGARSVGAAAYCQRHPETKLVLCTYISERTEQGRGWLRHLIRKQLVRRADAVTYNGPSCLSYLKRFPIADENLFHLPYAADDRSVYDGPVEREDHSTRHRLLVVGQLSQRKGVLPMLQQVVAHCRQRPNRHIHLVLAGDGPLRGAIEAIPLPANLKLTILGNVTPDHLAVWMLRSGAIVAPTLADEWLLVVNEGLQAGLPVIGSVHSQAVTTLIKDGHNGWRYDPMDDHALSRALDLYFGESADAIASMRDNSRNSVKERTPEWAASGALKAIKHVMNTNRDFSGSMAAQVDQRALANVAREEKSLVGLGGENV